MPRTRRREPCPTNGCSSTREPPSWPALDSPRTCFTSARPSLLGRAIFPARGQLGRCTVTQTPRAVATQNKCEKNRKETAQNWQICVGRPRRPRQRQAVQSRSTATLVCVRITQSDWRRSVPGAPVFAAMHGIGLAEEADSTVQSSLVLGVSGPLRSAPSAGMDAASHSRIPPPGTGRTETAPPEWTTCARRPAPPVQSSVRAYSAGSLTF